MARTSYGTADVFSPIRSDVSFNDDNLSAMVESDFFDEWGKPCNAVGNSEVKKKASFIHTDEASSRDHLESTVKINSIVEKKNKKNSSLEANFAHVTTRRSSHKGKKELAEFQEKQLTRNDKVSKTRKNNHTTGTQANSNKESLSCKTKCDASSVSPSNSADSNKDLFPRKIKESKDSAPSLAIPVELNKELPLNKMKQNKDSSSSLVIPADSNEELHSSKMKQNKDFAISLAIPADSNKELPSIKIKPSKDSASFLVNLADSKKDSLLSKIEQSKDSYSPSLTSLAEEQPERSPSFNADVGSMKSDCNYFGSSEVQAKTQVVLSMTAMKNHSKSKKLEKECEASVKDSTPIQKSVITSDSDHNNFTSSEEIYLDEETQGASAVIENSYAESASSNVGPKPEQIQANIIEKLVKDAVSFEFDGIRQMLYLQHLQLLKYIDRNAVNSDLQKTIEELAEENRRLKYIISHQNI